MQETHYAVSQFSLALKTKVPFPPRLWGNERYPMGEKDIPLAIGQEV